MSPRWMPRVLIVGSLLGAWIWAAEQLHFPRGAQVFVVGGFVLLFTMSTLLLRYLEKKSRKLKNKGSSPDKRRGRTS